MIGNDGTDLLNDLHPVKIGEDKFGKVEYLGLKSFDINTAEDFITLND